MTQHLALIPGLNNTHAVFDGVVAALPPQLQAHAMDNPALTSVEAIAQALLRASARGVQVRVLLDDKSDKTNRYVIDLLNQGQVPLRGDAKHAIAHNKVMVIDETVVITGSFNFTNAAETRNAENFLILKSPELARTYKGQWQIHWEHSRE